MALRNDAQQTPEEQGNLGEQNTRKVGYAQEIVVSLQSVEPRAAVALLVIEPGEHTADRNAETSSLVAATATGSKQAYQVLEGATVRIGRSKSNDIVVSDRDVSRFHASLNASSTGVVLSDLSSTNGTFVNGRRITTPVDLVSGDTITVGNIALNIILHITDGEREHDGTTTALADLRSVEVTVLLADVVAYTRMSQMLPSDDLARMLRTWFDRCGQIIERHGGEIDKYIGDCVMAIWRSGREKSQQFAKAAVLTALEIVEATNMMNHTEQWPHLSTHPWRCRTALNSGTALFGNMGATDSRNYTVLGDAVNIAFRVESLAGKLNANTLAAEATVQLVQDSFLCEKLGTFALEGRTEEVGIYSVLGPATEGSKLAPN